MKRIIYIDFENVSTAGLNGILELNEKDHVKIFLGPKCSKLSLIEAEAILHCNATVELITNDQIGKNALDFIIMVHMGYDIAKKAGKAFYIISKDKGYEPAIHEMQSMTGYTIERLQDIKEVLARDAETSKGGLFGFLTKKAPQVENTTEHEVYEKGKRVGKAKRSTRTELEQKTEQHARNEQNNRNENNNRNQYRGNAQSRDRKYEPRRHRDENWDKNKRRDGQARVEKMQQAAESAVSSDSKVVKPAKPEQNTLKPVVKQEPQKNKPEQPKQEVKQKQETKQPKPENVSQVSEPLQAEVSTEQNQSKTEGKQHRRERRHHERSKENVTADVNVDDLSVAELAQELGIRRSTRSTIADEIKSKISEETKPVVSTTVEHKENKDLPRKPEMEAVILATKEVTQNDASVAEDSKPGKSEKAKNKAGNKENDKKRPEPINEVEQALIDRAIATCKDKETYHNFLMGELRDTTRATELYKMSRNRFLRAKTAEQSSGTESTEE